MRIKTRNLSVSSQSFFINLKILLWLIKSTSKISKKIMRNIFRMKLKFDKCCLIFFVFMSNRSSNSMNQIDAINNCKRRWIVKNHFDLRFDFVFEIIIFFNRSFSIILWISIFRCVCRHFTTTFWMIDILFFTKNSSSKKNAIFMNST